MDKEAALREHLNTTAPITQSTYDPNLFIVNPHKTKYGDSPAEVIDTVEMLRAKLLTLFGPEAETWTSDFLRIQEMEAENLRPVLNDAKRRMEEAAKKLPMIECEFFSSSYSPKKEFPLCREMMVEPFKFKVPLVEGKQGFRMWVPCRNISENHKYLNILHNLEVLTKAYEHYREEYSKLRAYRNLEKVIKDSFDWNRLGNMHDNETAHAYQAIVNPLYLIGTSSKWNDGKYQQQLRDAFDRKALTDYRMESEANDGEYLVLTEPEAQAAVLEDIKESVWAFRAEFLAKWIPLKTADIRRLQEGCENCNEAILALIGNNLDDFVAAAVKSDGRGNFLSSYDSKEIKSGKYFIYRSN